MISIKLVPAVFNSGGLFDGVPYSRAVIHIGSGRNDLFLAKQPGPHPQGSLSWRGGQTYFEIGYAGSELEDESFEAMMQDSAYRSSVGVQILYLVQRGVIDVFQDGALLSATQIFEFAA